MIQKRTMTKAKSTGKKRRKTGPKKLREGERATVARALVGTVTAAELSEIVGLQDQRLRELAALGMPKASRGRYPLRDAVRFYVDTLRKRQEKPDEGPTRADISRDLDLLKLKKAQGEVFDRREVFDTMLGAYERLGVAHEQIATRIGRELNLTGEDVKMVRDMIDEMRAKFVTDSGEFIEVVEDPPAAAVA